MLAERSAYTEIGAFEAKTKLSELLRKVEQGERFTITVHGRPVAQLLPAPVRPSKERVRQAIETLRNFPKIIGVPGDEVLEWIREGRK